MQIYGKVKLMSKKWDLYKEADQVLYRILEENKTTEEILNEGFDKSLVENIVRRMNRSEYKRRMPLIAKIKR